MEDKITKGEIQYHIMPLTANELPAYMKSVLTKFGKGWNYFKIAIYSNTRYRVMYFCSQTKDPSINELATFIIRMRGNAQPAYKEWMSRLRELLTPARFNRINGDDKTIRKELDSWEQRGEYLKNTYEAELNSEWSKWS